MPDRENVIKTLEKIKAQTKEIGLDKAVLAHKFMDEIIELLKEQEPKQVEAEVINEIDRLYRCPSCHISMILRKQPYCHYCGQAVKWE